MDEVTLYLHGLPSTKAKGKLLRVEGDVAVLEEFVGREEARYRLSNGRRVEADGTEHWSAWRIVGEDLERLRLSAPAGVEEVPHVRLREP